MQTITAIAAATGIAPVTVQLTARALRETRDGLWPLAGRGGGKNARHVEPHHLANLILALCGQQPSDAAEVVAKMRPLRWAGRTTEATTPPEAADSATATFTLPQTSTGRPQADLGDTLDSIIDAIGRKGGAAAAPYRGADWLIGLSWHLGTAFITWREGSRQLRDQYEAPQGQLAMSEEAPPALIRRAVFIPFPLLEIAGALWADTLAHRSSYPSGSAPPEPEQQNAGSPPQGTGAARSADKPRKPHPKGQGLNNLKPRGCVAASQAASGARESFLGGRTNSHTQPRSRTTWFPPPF